MIEKRQSPRFNIRQLVKISSGIEDITDAVGLNISMNGIFCETNKFLDVNSLVYLVIAINNNNSSHNIEIEGKVVRIEKNSINNKFMVGISFINITEENKIRLNSLIKSLEQ